MSHKYQPPVSTNPFNVPVSTGETARKKVDVAKNIGFRGRHAHGKAPDDPVYPSRQLGATPRMGFVDWRTGGRALLVAAMAALEGRILRTRNSILKWQAFPTCSPSCGFACHKAQSRILCKWFTPGTVHEHYTQMDGLLTMYKGPKEIRLAKPPTKPMSQVAEINKFSSTTTLHEDGYDSDEDPASFGKDKVDLTRFDSKSLAEANLINNNRHI